MRRLISGLVQKLLVHDALFALGVAAFVLIAGLCYSYWLGPALRYPDETEYYALAKNIAQYGKFNYEGQLPSPETRTPKPPGFPLVLSLPVALGANVIWLRVVNYIALSASIIFVYLVAKLVYPAAPVGRVTAPIMVLGYPVLFYTAGTLYPQTVAAALFLGGLYFLVRGKNSIGPYAAAGTLFGLLILTVPTFVVAFLVSLLFLALTRTTRRTQWLAAFIVPCALLLGIWTARNYQYYGHPVFVAPNSGINLLLGNSPTTTPNAGPNVDISKFTSQTSGMGEVERDSYYRSKALEWIMANKTDAAILYVKKFINHFNYRNDLYVKSESSRIRDMIMLVSYGAICLLAVLRVALVRSVPWRREETLLIAFYLSGALVQAVFFTRIRYRLPFDFLLIVVGSAALGWLAARVMSRVMGVNTVMLQQAHVTTATRSGSQGLNPARARVDG